MQAYVRWKAPGGVLGTLVEAAGDRAKALRRDRSRLGDAAAAAHTPPGFVAALHDREHVGVIAEIKRSSPSRGQIAPGLRADAQAAAYAEGGAAAISVLTEPTRFGGSVDDLRAASGGGIPLLRKDFIVDGVQLLEARANGASAALLIVRALAPGHLAELHAEGTELGLDLLVEVHTEAELDLALACGYPLVGVNTRDLETLEIDASVATRVLPRIPASCVAVYESGVEGVADVERAAADGADAVLVGTSVSSAPDPAQAVRALASVTRVVRGQ